MKKVIFSLMVLCACSIVSCTKANDKENLDFCNRVVQDFTDVKESDSYSFRIHVGHHSSDCKGQCIKINGTPTHVDCLGFGHYCPLVSSVSLHQTGTAITATTTDTFGLTSQDFFLMPDRSLYFYTDESNNNVYLNIPEQMVYRDTATLQFTFTGLFFTNVPEYSND
jgi:hypothetical protein